jgi:two-component system, NtrC family, response regulator PilR
MYALRRLWQLVEERKTGVIRILLVDDDKHLLLLLEHTLLNNGYHVATADSVATGLSILRSQPFDLLITDVNLPDGIGLTIADEALAAGLKVLVMTAHGLSLKPGSLVNYDYLLKPVRIDELLDAVERRLAEPTPDAR